MPRNFWFLTLLVFGSIFPQLGWSQISVTVGSVTLQNTPTSYPAPYGNFYWGARHQMIIRASELNALGVSGGGLTSVGFMVVTPSGIPLQNFTISIGTTSDSVLSTNAGFVSGMTQVYSVPTYTDVVGWNTHVLSSLSFGMARITLSSKLVLITTLGSTMEMQWFGKPMWVTTGPCISGGTRWAPAPRHRVGLLVFLKVPSGPICS